MFLNPPVVQPEPNSGYQPSDLWEILQQVPDPEIPVVSIEELGILRDILSTPDGFEVVITPTYSGCPAVDQIRDDIRAVLSAHAIHVTVTTRLSPAWTTDWMSQATRDKLRAYGIAPPAHLSSSSQTSENHKVIQFAPKKIATHANRACGSAQFDSHDVVCPQCGSHDTTETSHFGSTACKALYKCLACQEPFDYFKPY
jgi:ring-1,2-phenylacetyl-CoA epoxidase subunit PaaD